MTTESTCIRVKDLDLYIIETAYKFIKISVVLLFKYESFYLNKQELFICISFFWS